MSGSLSTYYSGARPTASGYNPMSKEGAIVLGIGGDNSNGAQGTFYEGVMTAGYPSDATEDLICQVCRMFLSNTSWGEQRTWLPIESNVEPWRHISSLVITSGSKKQV